LDPVAFRNLVDEVKERTDLVELIGRDIELRSSGSHFVGHSPWNRDTTPSLVVWPDSQRWMDYSGGGNGGGDCISYLQRREGIDFMEALRELAARAGVAMPNGSSGDAAEATQAMIERRRIEDLHAIAATYYHGGLPAKIRKQWLQDRYGFTDEIIDRLLLGWADGHLFDHLTETAGANTEEALSTGLFVRKRDGRVVDLFCNRIVFPYWRRGRVCYFIARQTEHTDDKPWEQAKYKKLLTHSEKHPYVSKQVPERHLLRRGLDSRCRRDRGHRRGDRRHCRASMRPGGPLAGDGEVSQKGPRQADRAHQACPSRVDL
jgi:DNA primase